MAKTLARDAGRKTSKQTEGARVWGRALLLNSVQCDLCVDFGGTHRVFLLLCACAQVWGSSVCSRVHRLHMDIQRQRGRLASAPHTPLAEIGPDLPVLTKLQLSAFGSEAPLSFSMSLNTFDRNRRSALSLQPQFAHARSRATSARLGTRLVACTRACASAQDTAACPCHRPVPIVTLHQQAMDGV